MMKSSARCRRTFPNTRVVYYSSPNNQRQSIFTTRYPRRLDFKTTCMKYVCWGKNRKFHCLLPINNLPLIKNVQELKCFRHCLALSNGKY